MGRWLTLRHISPTLHGVWLTGSARTHLSWSGWWTCPTPRTEHCRPNTPAPAASPSSCALWTSWRWWISWRPRSWCGPDAAPDPRWSSSSTDGETCRESAIRGLDPDTENPSLHCPRSLLSSDSSPPHCNNTGNVTFLHACILQRRVRLSWSARVEITSVSALRWCPSVPLLVNAFLLFPSERRELCAPPVSTRDTWRAAIRCIHGDPTRHGSYIPREWGHLTLKCYHVHAYIH